MVRRNGDLLAEVDVDNDASIGQIIARCRSGARISEDTLRLADTWRAKLDGQRQYHGLASQRALHQDHAYWTSETVGPQEVAPCCLPVS